jgi:hypothetical protein
MEMFKKKSAEQNAADLACKAEEATKKAVDAAAALQQPGGFHDVPVIIGDAPRNAQSTTSVPIRTGTLPKPYDPNAQPTKSLTDALQGHSTAATDYRKALRVAQERAKDPYQKKGGTPSGETQKV